MALFVLVRFVKQVRQSQSVYLKSALLVLTPSGTICFMRVTLLAMKHHNEVSG